MTLPLAVLAFIKKWKFAIAGAVLLVAIFSLVQCGVKIGRQGEVVKQQEREIETQIDLGKANEGAAAARVEEATRAAEQMEELKDALEATDDPDRQRVLRGCIILRQQGRDTTDFPACR